MTHEGEQSADGEPNWFDKINFIIAFWIDPCDAPLTVYAKTLWPAVVDFLWEYYQPDVSNVLVNLFRWRYIIPRVRTKKKGRGGQKNKKGPFGKLIGKVTSFDQDEWISRRISNWTALTGRKVSSKFVTLLIVEGVIERLNFWLFMFELFLDLFYKWSSLMKKTIYCQAAGDDVLLAEGPSQPTIGIFGWIALVMPHVRKQRGRVTWNVSAGSFLGENGVCVVSCTVKNLQPNPISGVGIRITVHYGFTGTKGYVTKRDMALGAEDEITVTAPLPKNSHWVVECIVEAGAADFTNPVISVHGVAPKDQPTDG